MPLIRRPRWLRWKSGRLYADKAALAVERAASFAVIDAV
jgi:hypothetical protein